MRTMLALYLESLLEEPKAQHVTATAAGNTNISHEGVGGVQKAASLSARSARVMTAAMFSPMRPDGLADWRALKAGRFRVARPACDFRLQSKWQRLRGSKTLDYARWRKTLNWKRCSEPEGVLCSWLRVSTSSKASPSSRPRLCAS